MGRSFNAADWQVVPIHTTGTVSATFSALGRTAYRSNVNIEIHIENDNAPGTFVFFARGLEFDLFFDVLTKLRFQCAANTVIYRYVPAESSFEDDVSEVDFVNIDSMPEESGHMQQINAALRAMELRHRQEMLDAYSAVGVYPPEHPAVSEPNMPGPTADGDTDA